MRWFVELTDYIVEMRLTRSRHHKKRSTKRSTRKQKQKQRGGDIFPLAVCEEEARKLCNTLKNTSLKNKEKCLMTALRICKEEERIYNNHKNTPHVRRHGSGSSENLRKFLKEMLAPPKSAANKLKPASRNSPETLAAIREACMETAARRCSNGPIENFDQCIADATALCNRI